MKFFKRLDLSLIHKLLIFLVIFSLGLGFGSKYFNRFSDKNEVVIEKNTSKLFIGEIYDKIKENFWDNISDGQLLEFFRLSIDKNGAQSNVVKIENKQKLLEVINNVTKQMTDEEKQKFLPMVAGTVLASLNPAGRSGLYTEKLEQQLKNTVNNVDPNKDLYKDLGLDKGASTEAVAKAYEEKLAELKKDNTPEAKEKLKQITYSNEVLTKKDTKMRYDTAQVEPTIFTKTIGSILYIQFKKFSPTSYDEFVKTFESYNADITLSGLIFDLRGNIGGAIDATPYFLGNFIGKGAYAFDFYHKGEYLPFKTPTDKLASIAKYKQIVILVDNGTQSSAEIMAASFKKYHVGVVVGVTTKGWGTVERVFPLDNQISKTEKYSVFLVHSITLRDDNQPIEGRGVDPDVNIKSADWEKQLYSFFSNQQLVNAARSIMEL